MGGREGLVEQAGCHLLTWKRKGEKRRLQAQIGILCRVLGCRVRQFGCLLLSVRDPRKARLSGGPELWAILSGRSFLTAPRYAPSVPCQPGLGCPILPTFQTLHSYCPSRLCYLFNIELAKKSIWVFLQDVMENQKVAFSPAQYTHHLALGLSVWVSMCLLKASSLINTLVPAPALLTRAQ